MPELILGLSRAQSLVAAGRYNRSTACLVVNNPDGDLILFWKNKPIALTVGCVVYWHQLIREQGATRAINALAPMYPRLSVDAKQFDFMVGSLLTKTGLRLTHPEPVEEP